MIKNILKNISNLVYPRICVACKKTLGEDQPTNYICYSCLSAIQKNKPPFCQICGRHLDPKKGFSSLCVKCKRSRYAFDRAFSPCSYSGTTRELIQLLKYKNKIYLAKPLAGFLVEFIKEYDFPIDMADLIVPIPLHKRKLREREFNQSQLLAKHVSDEFNVRLSDGNLFRIKDNQAQAELTDEKRWENVMGIFGLNNPIEFSNKTIILIDDVITTGATVSEAASTLKENGANLVFVLTLAS